MSLAIFFFRGVISLADNQREQGFNLQMVREQVAD